MYCDGHSIRICCFLRVGYQRVANDLAIDRQIAACFAAYAEMPHCIRRGASERKAACSSHHIAFQSKKQMVRRISSVTRRTSSLHRSARAFVFAHSDRIAVKVSMISTNSNMIKQYCRSPRLESSNSKTWCGMVIGWTYYHWSRQLKQLPLEAHPRATLARSMITLSSSHETHRHHYGEVIASPCCGRDTSAVLSIHRLDQLMKVLYMRHCTVRRHG